MNIKRSDDVENLESLVSEVELKRLEKLVSKRDDEQCSVCGKSESNMFIDIKNKNDFQPLDMEEDDLHLVCSEHADVENNDVKNSSDDNDVEQQTKEIQKVSDSQSEEQSDEKRELEDETSEDDEQDEEYFDNMESDESFTDYMDDEYEEDESTTESTIEDDPLINEGKEDGENEEEEKKGNLLVERSISERLFGFITILSLLMTLIFSVTASLQNTILIQATTIPIILIGGLIYALSWDLVNHVKIYDEEPEDINSKLTRMLIISLISIIIIIPSVIGVISIKTVSVVGLTGLLISYYLDDIAKYDTVELIEDNIKSLYDNPVDKDSRIKEIMLEEQLDVVENYKSILFQFVNHLSGFAGFVASIVILISVPDIVAYGLILILLINPVTSIIYLIYRRKWYNKFNSE